MSRLSETLLESLQQEIDKQVHESLTKFAEFISNRYDISLRLLLQDLSTNLEVPSTPTSVSIPDGRCAGMTAKGKRCNFTAKQGGYCKHHQDQKRVARPVIRTESYIDHIHTIPPLFMKGCPACEKSNENEKVHSENLLIDF